MATPIDNVVLKCRKIFPTGNGEIVRYLPDKKNKNSAPYKTVAIVRMAPKMCQGQPQPFGSQFSKFHRHAVG